MDFVMNFVLILYVVLMLMVIGWALNDLYRLEQKKQKMKEYYNDQSMVCVRCKKKIKTNYFTIRIGYLCKDCGLEIMKKDI